MVSKLKSHEIGTYFGKVQYLGDQPRDTWTPSGRMSFFKCYCGIEYGARLSSVIAGGSKSCGCLRKEKVHNFYKTRQYYAWSNMKSRCNNENHEHYLYYGGRGITYDDSWETFEGFWQDMSDGYSDELELDRIDPNKNYCKSNCRWVDGSVQSFNTNRQKSNKSGKTGVFFNKKNSKWLAYISKNNIKTHLGSFISYEDACNARDTAEIEFYGFNVS